MSRQHLQDLIARLTAIWLLAVASVLCAPGAANASFNLPTATEIVSANSGQCLTVAGAVATAGANIVQQPCTGASSQLWTWAAVPHTTAGFHLINSLSGLCLNVYGAGTKLGAQLIQWPCQGANGPNDEWNLTNIGGYQQVINVNSKYCVNVYGASQTAGATIIQWSCQGLPGRNDKFDLYLPTPPANTLPSSWTPVIPLPVTPIGVANLPNGNLLMWSANAPYTFENGIGNTTSQTYTGIFTPSTQTSTQLLVTSLGADFFCPGTALLPSGTVLINGGSSNFKTSLYDPFANTWTSGAQMNIGRGYEADTLLSNGNVFTLGGSWSGGIGGKVGEVYNPVTGWTLLTGVPETNIIGPDPQGIFRGDNHGWFIGTSNGNVFHAGPSAQMNWISTAGSGSITSAGTRGTDAFSINGNAVLYDIGMILKVGGAPAYQQDLATTTYATASAYTININGGPTQPVTVSQLAGMNYPRAFSNAVVLPNGNVVVVGGQTIPQPFTDTGAVLVPEIWNPATQQFSLLAPMDVPRTYHSSAVLLNDGRVFVGGGGQCGTGCANNHLDAQILTPPYLYTAAGTLATQATITSAPATAALGTSITVNTSVPVASFVLMRLGVATHTVNNDQRRVPVFSTPLASGGYALLLPSDPGIALPGYYFLFALDANGVPSVSVPLQLTAPAATAPPATAASCAAEGGSCVLPAGATATVWYGAGSAWSVIGNLAGSVPCTNAAFSAPAPSTGQSCVYQLTPPPSAVACAQQGGTCSLPANASATVWYGADTNWTLLTGVTGAISCADTAFSDPEPSASKACAYQLH